MGEIDSPALAIEAMADRIAPVPTEGIPIASARGRVLAQEVRTDRPSPAFSMSAMDGYAICLADACPGRLDVRGEARIGRPPPAHVQGAAIRIYTGSPIPQGSDAVIKREDVREIESEGVDQIEIEPEVYARVRAGQNIRFQGENAPGGACVLREGDVLTPTAVGALHAFALKEVRVSRRARVTMITTGDELVGTDAPVDAFCIRDSNGPTVCAALGALRWVQVHPPMHVHDARDALRTCVETALAQSDAIVLSGGVSMGRYDFVPEVLESLACQTVFHKLPQRPGHPMLGAIAPAGKPVLGLPGNPVSVLCTLHRVGVPVLCTLGGLRHTPLRALVTLTTPPEQSIPLWWYRPVRLVSDGHAALIENKGSGDVASIAASDGFVEIPPNAHGAGAYPFYPWLV